MRIRHLIMDVLFGTILFSLLLHVRLTSCMTRSKCVHIDYRGKRDLPVNSSCTMNKVCNKTFMLSAVTMPPYSYYPINAVLEQCCGSCTKFKEIKYFSNITEVTPHSLHSSDFSILYLTSSSADTLYGHHFIPVIYAPSIYYITPKDEPIIKRLVSSCLNLYPLIIICLLLAVISGFIAWLMETWNNKEEFPREFLIGWFEGFWWGFVSMTTVGYGDKTPKSIQARVFSIIWILVGVAMFGIFTAMLTTEIMKANNPKEPLIAGLNVGVLQFREYDASFVAKQGGSVVESNGWDFQSDLLQLIGMLRRKEIDGIVLDKYTLRYATSSLDVENGTTANEQDINFFMHDTARTEKVTGKEYSYGILVKHINDYRFFRNAIVDNRLPLETEIALAYNKNNAKKSNDILFSPQGPHFVDSLKVIGGIIGAVCCFGVFFELWRRYMPDRTTIPCKSFQNKGELV